MKKFAVVLTTINVPHLLHDFADNFEKYGHKEYVEFIMVGDLKTPPETYKIVKEITKRGFRIEYFDVEKQKQWLKRFPELDAIIPYNSDNRRNIGFLFAKERGIDVVLSIDDDNWPQKHKDYLKAHSIVGNTVTLPTVSSKNNWYNICRHVTTSTKTLIYPRGFPYFKRWKDTANITSSKGKVMMNAGLWLNHPDADAVTNLNEPLSVVKIQEKYFMLSPKTFSPINTQNTAFHIDILPCYWYVVMGEKMNGQKIDRYGDIWSGFFSQKVISHMGHRLSFGPPASVHNRNKHNLFKDLQQETGGMILTERLAPILESIKLTKKTYGKSYVELSKKILSQVIKSKDFTDEEKAYFKKIDHCVNVWVNVCDKIQFGSVS